MSDDLRERQAAYRDWLDRERQRAALAGAACGKCVFWSDDAPDSGESGVCWRSEWKVSGDSHVQKLGRRSEHYVLLGIKTDGQDLCEHYLPRAEHDPRPKGGTP